MNFLSICKTRIKKRTTVLSGYHLFDKINSYTHFPILTSLLYPLDTVKSIKSCKKHLLNVNFSKEQILLFFWMNNLDLFINFIFPFSILCNLDHSQCMQFKILIIFLLFFLPTIDMVFIKWYITFITFLKTKKGAAEMINNKAKTVKMNS